MKPEISIIIPVFNVEETIYPTLKSILDQTFENIEVIIVNDGSVDNTQRILKRYAKLDSRIKLLDSHAEGEAFAQNLGLKTATGKYVMFFKVGNIMSSNLFEYLFPIMETHKCGIIACDYFMTSELEFHGYYSIESPEKEEENLTFIDSNKYFENMSSTDDHIFKTTCVFWNKLIDKSILANFEFDTSKLIPNPFAIQKLLTSHISMIVSNQKLIAMAKIDEFFEQISFSYNELDKIEFLQNLLIYFKKSNNQIALKNTAINLLDLLYKIRLKLNSHFADIYDLEEQKANINQKFSSVRKFLKSHYPDSKSEYIDYFNKYKKILDSEIYIKNHPSLYPEPQKKFHLPDEEAKADEL